MSFSMGMDFGGLLGVLNPLNWMNYAEQKRQYREQKEYQRQQDNANRQMQYDFAQNSIKWRVDDANRSGIHPLAALGVNPASASPVYTSDSGNPPQMPGADMFSGLLKTQLDLAKAEVKKTEAETRAIEEQIDSPSGIQPKTLAGPEKVARVVERPAEKGIVKSFAVEPSQQEIDKYESLPFLTGAVEYVRNYHFNGYENATRIRPQIEANLRKMAKKKGIDFDSTYSLVIRGNKLNGYTLDLIKHEDIDKFISAGDKWSQPTKKNGWKKGDSFLERNRPKYNW